MVKYKSDAVVCGKTLLEWFRNDQLSCFLGWPKAIRHIAVGKGLGACPFVAMLRNGKCHKYRKSGKDLQAGGVYKLWPGHEWLKGSSRPKGKFVLYNVDSAGNYTYVHNKDAVTLPWDWISMEDGTRTFAGWLWLEPSSKRKFLSTDRYGYTKKGVLTISANSWANPAVPIGVRFWVNGIKAKEEPEGVVQSAAIELYELFKKHKLCLTLNGDDMHVIMFHEDKPQRMLDLTFDGGDVEDKEILEALKERGWDHLIKKE